MIAGQTVDLNGSGTVTPLGTVEATGTVEGVGSIAHGHAMGAISLSGTAGNLTLELSGPSQRGGAALADRLSLHHPRRERIVPELAEFRQRRFDVQGQQCAEGGRSGRSVPDVHRGT